MFIPDVINTLLMGLIFIVIVVTVVRKDPAPAPSATAVATQPSASLPPDTKDRPRSVPKITITPARHGDARDHKSGDEHLGDACTQHPAPHGR